MQHFKDCQIVAICPRREDGDWFSPGLTKVEDGNIELTNSSCQSVTLKKGNRVCKVRNVIEVSPEEIQNVRKVFNGFPDSFQYKSLAVPDNNSYFDDVQVDPDDIMREDQKKMFRDLCAKYTDIITPRPGRYNNYSGHVDNSINFAEKPPSNQRVYQPNYSDKMKELLGSKMDKLEGSPDLPGHLHRFPESVNACSEERKGRV